MPYNFQPTRADEVDLSGRLAAQILLDRGIPFYAEWEFDRQLGGDRRWRHDLFIPCASLGEKLGIAIEIEGGMRPDGGFTRHTLIKGFASDAEKYALSQSYGNYIYRTSTQDWLTKRVMKYVVRHYARLEGLSY